MALDFDNPRAERTLGRRVSSHEEQSLRLLRAQKIKARAKRSEITRGLRSVGGTMEPEVHPYAMQKIREEMDAKDRERERAVPQEPPPPGYEWITPQQVSDALEGGVLSSRSRFALPALKVHYRPDVAVTDFVIDDSTGSKMLWATVRDSDENRLREGERWVLRIAEELNQQIKAMAERRYQDRSGARVSLSQVRPHDEPTMKELAEMYHRMKTEKYRSFRA